MANALFAFGKETLLSTTNYNGFGSDSIKDVLVDHGTDTPVPATDTHLPNANKALAMLAPVLWKFTYVNGCACAGCSCCNCVSWTDV